MGGVIQACGGQYTASVLVRLIARCLLLDVRRVLLAAYCLLLSAVFTVIRVPIAWTDW